MDAPSESISPARRSRLAIYANPVLLFGKPYVPAKAQHALGLSPSHLRSLKEGVLPNGEPADVAQDLNTKEIYYSQELIDRLHGRFVYADNEQSLGPCRVHSGQWKGIRYQNPKIDNQLRPVSLILKDVGFRDKEAERQYQSWINTGIGPEEMPVRKVRDTLTGDHLLTLGTMYQIYKRTGFSQNYR